MSGNVDELRPQELSEFVGQKSMIEELQIRAQAAKHQNRTLDHMLLCGPPGSGKTTMASLVAGIMGVQFRSLVMPVTLGMLGLQAAICEGVLLLDEVHRLSRKGQEDLLPLIEFGYIQAANGRKIQANNLTIVAATTEPDKIIKPLYDRFVLKPPFEDYSDEEMAQIAQGMASKANVYLTLSDAMILGRAAAGIPRRARQFVLALRDLTDNLGRPATAKEALALCRTDLDGLTLQHRKYLDTLAKMGGQAGLKLLASLLSLNEGVVCDMERQLFATGLVEPSAQGRQLTPEGFKKVRQMKESSNAA